MKKILLFCSLLLGVSAFVSAQSLTILCEDDEPLQMKGADGKPTGMVVDLVKEIQKRVGNTDPIQIVPWNNGYTRAQKDPNVVLFSMTRNAERDKMFHWVGPTKESRFALYTLATSKITLKSLEEAKTLKAIGVYLGDIRDQILTKAGFTNLDRAPDNLANIKKLIAGRLDAYASSDSNIKVETEKAGIKVSDLKEIAVIQRVQIYIAMSLGTPKKVVDDWNAALDKMKADGTFEKIFKKYLPADPLPGKAITTF